MIKSGKGSKGPGGPVRGNGKITGTRDRVTQQAVLKGVKLIMGWNVFRAKIHGSQRVPPKTP